MLEHCFNLLLAFNYLFLGDQIVEWIICMNATAAVEIRDKLEIAAQYIKLNALY